MFQVRIVRLQHRLRADAPAEDLWRLLGTTTLQPEKRALWEVNDLRLGDGAGLAADRMSELATETPDRSTQVALLQVRENMDFVIPIGGERQNLEILWTDASGRLMGRRFEKAQAQFRLVCRGDAEEPGAVRIALVPEIISGAEEMRWVPTETAATPRMMRPAFVLSDFAAEVRLSPARLLVLGGRRSAELSLGGALFFEHRGPDVWTLSVILTVERLKAGATPEGDVLPFLKPGGGSPAKPAVNISNKPGGKTPANTSPTAPKPPATPAPAPTR
jgi:hypothetical protein